MKIVLVYADYENISKEILEKNPRADKHMKKIVDDITKALQWGGHEVFPVIGNNDCLNKISEIKPDLIFCHYAPMEKLNLQGNVFAMLELSGIPIVGSSMFTQAVGLSKETTKILLRDKNIRTTKSQVFFNKDDELNEDLEFPLFVKPEREACSVGVRNDSYVENEHQLRETLDRIFNEIEGPVLVEEYLVGREFTVGVLEEDPIRVLPIMELKFSQGDRFRSIESVNKRSLEKVFPDDLDEEVIKEMEYMAKESFKALRADVYARIDMRMDSKGRPNIIEFNTMPGLLKGGSFFETEANAIGMNYNQLINKMVEITVKKYNIGDMENEK